MKINLVIFDLDGTLIDTIGDLSAAVEHALSEGGFPGHTVDEYRRMVGHGIRNLVTRALPEGSSEKVVETALSSFVSYYSSHIDVLSRPYPGINELLRDLSQAGVKLAVASNKFQAGTEALIRRFFPDIPFVKIIGNAPGLPLKPDAEVVKVAIDAFSSNPERFDLGSAEGSHNNNSKISAALVGDSATDIKTARNAGIPAIAVSWGFRPRADLEIADVVVDSVEQLHDILLGG